MLYLGVFMSALYHVYRYTHTCIRILTFVCWFKYICSDHVCAYVSSVSPSFVLNACACMSPCACALRMTAEACVGSLLFGVLLDPQVAAVHVVK